MAYSSETRLNEIHGTGAIQINCAFDADLFFKLKSKTKTKAHVGNTDVCEGEPVFRVHRPCEALGLVSKSSAPTQMMSCRLLPVFSKWRELAKHATADQKDNLQQNTEFVGFARQDVKTDEAHFGKGSTHLAVRTAGLATINVHTDVSAGEFLYVMTPAQYENNKHEGNVNFDAYVASSDALVVCSEKYLKPECIWTATQQCNNRLPCVIGKAIRTARAPERTDVKLCRPMPPLHFDSL
jgi:hypothetical protein